MSYLRALSGRDVNDAQSLAEYARQNLGVPVTKMGVGLLRKQAEQFMRENPGATWDTFVKTVKWAKANKRRPTDVFRIVGLVRYAHAAGATPELNSDYDAELEARISYAYAVETEPAWLQMLQNSKGNYRIDVYEAWVHERGAAHDVYPQPTMTVTPPQRRTVPVPQPSLAF